jgi:hypothetical protein
MPPPAAQALWQAFPPGVGGAIALTVLPEGLGEAWYDREQLYNGFPSRAWQQVAVGGSSVLSSLDAW